MQALLISLVGIVCAPFVCAEFLRVPDGQEAFGLPHGSLLVNDSTALIQEDGETKAITRIISSQYRNETLSPAGFQRQMETEVFARTQWEAKAGQQTTLFDRSATKRQMIHASHGRAISATYFMAEETPHLLLVEARDEKIAGEVSRRLINAQRVIGEVPSRRRELRRALGEEAPKMVALGHKSGTFSLVFVAGGLALAFREGELHFQIVDSNDELVTELRSESAFSLFHGVKGLRLRGDDLRVIATFNGAVVCESEIILPPRKAK